MKMQVVRRRRWRWCLRHGTLLLFDKETGMNHPIYRVGFLKDGAPYTLRVCFDDSTERVIDFQSVPEGE